jgi:hypothetical protein
LTYIKPGKYIRVNVSERGSCTRYRVLAVGTDVGLLKTRRALLVSGGYDSVIATPEDCDEKLQSGGFDLIILSMLLSENEQRDIQAKLPIGTRTLVLKTLVRPDEFLRMVAEALA